jgi:8-oxo-dGTP diphosphatase
MFEAEPHCPRIAVSVLLVQRKLVLLGRRSSAGGGAMWSAPNGDLKFGDELEQCGQQALLDATGLTAALWELGHYSNDVFAQEGRHVLTVFVVARGAPGAPKNLVPDQYDGWAWFGWDLLPHPLSKPLQTLVAIGWRPDGA